MSRHLLRDAYADYLAATAIKDRGRDAVERLWKLIDPELGHLFTEDIRTSEMDQFKGVLPKHLGPKSVNQDLILIGAVLRFMCKRGKLSHVPYMPREKVSKRFRDWYTQEERDQLLDGIYRLQPQWYLFFYLTTRLGLRLGEVYALAYRQVRAKPPRLIVDQAVQRGTKMRPAILVTRKNDEAYVLDLTDDVQAAIEWHIAHGYAGQEFLFSKTGEFPRYIDSHKRPLDAVQEARSTEAGTPRDRSALGGESGGDGRDVHQGDPGTAWASLGAEHACVRASGFGSSALRSHVASAGLTAARHPGGTRNENGRSPNHGNRPTFIE